MELTYKWEFAAPRVVLSEDGLSNIVSSVYWKLIATTSEEEPHIAVFSNTTSFPKPSGDNFVPFEQLTELQIISWISAVENIEQVKEQLQSQINSQINPTEKNIDFPFVT
jgi:hypothetical protein